MVKKYSTKSTKNIPMEKSLEQLMDEHFEFTSKTFVKSTAVSSLIHLAGNEPDGEVFEVLEAIELGHDIETIAEEYADCFNCLNDSMKRAGVTTDMFIRAVYKKLEINKARKWIENPDGTYRHVKPGQCPKCGECNRIREGNTMCVKCVAELYDENK